MAPCKVFFKGQEGAKMMVVEVCVWLGEGVLLSYQCSESL